MRSMPASFKPARICCAPATVPMEIPATEYEIVIATSPTLPRGFSLLRNNRHRCQRTCIFDTQWEILLAEKRFKYREVWL
jgi:hypothetical protein